MQCFYVLIVAVQGKCQGFVLGKNAGELTVYPCSGICRRPSSVHNVQTSFLKPLGQSKPNFMWSLLGKGEQKYI